MFGFCFACFWKGGGLGISFNKERKKFLVINLGGLWVLEGKHVGWSGVSQLEDARDNRRIQHLGGGSDNSAWIPSNAMEKSQHHSGYELMG